ncbi:MAG TPA: citryl-CoA lyase [Albitalea sp.]|uniref:citryl-CoA lyase n=1 Tax=Piscinibacter sp. TaxID=1903157 RepID=UPI002ED5681D
MSSPDTIATRIWHEEAEPDNPFATRSARCHGYDVYGEMLGRATWVEMLFLLFRGEAPTPAQSRLLEALAVALANAGPRDAAVHAAMSAGVGGSPAAAMLMAALAVGAGQHGGAREVLLAMQAWADGGAELAASPADDAVGVWPTVEHTPGFDPNARHAATTVVQALERLAGLSTGAALPWLADQRPALEAATGLGLAMTGVAAAAFIDLGFTPDQGEMLHLLLRLPGAAAHALEQRESGHKNFPFFSLELVNDPQKEAA